MASVRAVATELARQGWAVCINYREREDCARSLVEQLTGEGCRVMAVQADVACREQVNTMVRQVEDTFGPVSLLVNNAGVAGQALFQDITDELWHRYFSVNVDGAYHAIQAVLPAMLHHHEGCIINTSSIWGLRGASCEVTYSLHQGGPHRPDPVSGGRAGPHPHPGELRGAGRHPHGYAGRPAR